MGEYNKNILELEIIMVMVCLRHIFLSMSKYELTIIMHEHSDFSINEPIFCNSYLCSLAFVNQLHNLKLLMARNEIYREM